MVFYPVRKNFQLILYIFESFYLLKSKSHKIFTISIKYLIALYLFTIFNRVICRILYNNLYIFDIISIFGIFSVRFLIFYINVYPSIIQSFRRVMKNTEVDHQGLSQEENYWILNFNLGFSEVYEIWTNVTYWNTWITEWTFPHAFQSLSVPLQKKDNNKQN